MKWITFSQNSCDTQTSIPLLDLLSWIFIKYRYWGSPVFTWTCHTAWRAGSSLSSCDVITSRCHVGSWAGEFATMASTALCWAGTQWSWPLLGIWRMCTCLWCSCCSVIAPASAELLAFCVLLLLSLVSPPVVVGPRCVLTEASVLGSALHLATTKQLQLR